MRKFVIQFTIFLFPIFLILVWSDSFISKKLKASHLYLDEYSTWNDLYDGKINSDVLIYGSSRAWVHIDPNMINDSLHKKTYNLGVDGHNFWMQYLRHKLMLINNPKPKFIIYSLDIFTLKKRTDLYNAEQFLPYMLFNNDLKDGLNSYKGFGFFDFEVPLIRYYGRKECILNAFNMLNPSKNDVTFRNKGFQGKDEQWNNDLAEVKKRMSSFKIDLDSTTIVLFERFLQECRNEGIKVIFVYSPEYIEGQKFLENRDEILLIYKNLSNKYNIPFFDYSNDPMSFQKDYFFNSMHLNKAGAELFTSKFIDTLRTTKVLN